VQVSGDGRLDLDDLGQVVENATPLDGPEHRDELAGGGEGPTWSERSAPARAWLHRHRVAVSGVAAFAVALGVGAVAWEVRQPPPAAETLAASLTLPLDAQDVPLFLDERGAFSVPLRVTATREGETARIVGLSGPGIAASAVSPLDEDTVSLRGILDCGLDPLLALGPTAAQHLVEVETRDAYGRAQRGRLPAVGVTEVLATQVPAYCAQRAAQEGITAEAVGATADGEHLDVRMSMTNRTEHAVRIDISPVSGNVLTTADPVVIASGRSRFWDVRLTLLDCADPRIDLALPDGTLVDSLTDGAAGVAPVIESMVTLSAASIEASSAGWESSYLAGPTWRQVRLDGIVPEVRAWMARTCSGRPAVRAVPLDVGRVSRAPSAADPSQVAVPITFEADLPAGSVTLTGAMPDPWNAPVPRLVPAPDVAEAWAVDDVGTDRRTRTFTAVWLFTCVGDLSPPAITATVEAGGVRSPWQVRLADDRLARAVLDACPNETAESLMSWTWDPPPGSMQLPRG
jgi:hypothetical protein